MIDYISLFKSAKEYFLKNENNAEGYVSGKIQIYSILLPDQTTLNIFGIDRNDMLEQNWQDAKALFANKTGVAAIDKTYQFVGISATAGYSSNGTSFIESKMRKKLTHQNRMFFYGGTGCENPSDKARANVNGCLNRVLDQLSPSGCACVFANIVDATLDVIKNHGATISQNVRNFVYVYGSNGYETQFGDDNLFADAMTDVLIDYSGGPQSLAQAINVIAMNKKVSTVSGVRTDRGEAGFSSTGFLLSLKEKLARGELKTEDEYLTHVKDYCAEKGMDIKWDSHTKDAQLKFAFENIQRLSPEKVVESVKFTQCKL